MDADPIVVQRRSVLDTDELLSRLKDKGVRNVDIARALDLPESRITGLRRKERSIKLDEAVKLVRAFGLEEESQATQLPASIVRLVVRYVALELRAEPTNQQLEELTLDVQAFAAFAADPMVRGSVEAAEAFFRALQRRRPEPGIKGRSRNNHEPTS